MSENVVRKENREAFEKSRDTKVTAISLIFIAIQSIIIILGFLYRWDWLTYECAAVLIGSAIVIFYYGMKALINANALMNASIDEGTEAEEGNSND